MMTFINYLRDTRAEMRHVTWPTRAQAVSYTLIVISISIGTGVFLGFLDFIFKNGIELFV